MCLPYVLPFFHIYLPLKACLYCCLMPLNSYFVYPDFATKKLFWYKYSVKTGIEVFLLPSLCQCSGISLFPSPLLPHLSVVSLHLPVGLLPLALKHMLLCFCVLKNLVNTTFFLLLYCCGSQLRAVLYPGDMWQCRETF